MYDFHNNNNNNNNNNNKRIAVNLIVIHKSKACANIPIMAINYQSVLSQYDDTKFTWNVATYGHVDIGGLPPTQEASALWAATPTCYF